MGDGTPFESTLRRSDSAVAVRKSEGSPLEAPRGAMVRVVRPKAPIDFKELEGSRSGSEGQLFLVPSAGCIVHRKASQSGRRPGMMGKGPGGVILASRGKRLQKLSLKRKCNQTRVHRNTWDSRAHVTSRDPGACPDSCNGCYI